jgi:hypothetical protein
LDVTHLDDTLVFGSTKEEHDKNLKEVLRRIQDSGLKLNQNKCVFGVTEVEFLGQVLDAKGIRPSNDKVAAILQMPDPCNKAELRRVLGMINYLGRFVPNLSELLRPVSELLCDSSVWNWDEPQAAVFRNVEKKLVSAPTLAHFDISKPTVVSADASSYGMGADIMQECSGQLKPVAFASRTLSPAETRYAQIEKECIASTWTCEKFSHYLFGLDSFYY